MTAILQVRSTGWSYTEAGKRKPVLNDINFSIERGESVALIGASGSGKSTLLNLVGGIDRPDSGEIRLHGTVMQSLKEPDLTLFRRRHIGYVYQLFNLIPTLSVLENAALPLELMSVPAADIRAETARWLERVDLADRLHAFPDQLSGGEQQRVALVRALIHQPDLVLADEPTGNLDAESGRKILDLLMALSEENNQSLLVVTHSHEVAQRCDRVLRLESGRVVSDESGASASAW